MHFDRSMRKDQAGLGSLNLAPPPPKKKSIPGRAPSIGTELSIQCKYGVIHSQMHRFSRRLRRSPLFCKATGQLLANLIQHGYDRVKLWVKIKPFFNNPAFLQGWVIPPASCS